jgi:hypothetical protein
MREDDAWLLLSRMMVLDAAVAEVDDQVLPKDNQTTQAAATVATDKRKRFQE